MKKLVHGSAAAVLALVVACGGNVVVDGANPGTGAGSTSGTTTTPSGGGGASCFNLPTVPTLTPCGGSSGGPDTLCSFLYCDQADTWEADCSASTCQCLHNGNVICTCALTSAGDICSGTPDCCYNALH